MRNGSASAIAAVLLPLAMGLPASASAQVSSELDAYWAEAARTVEEGDFEGYAELYHSDAVLVMLGQGTVPIAKALDGWKQLFLDTRDGKASADVEFRLTERLHDATTAHETGIFRYAFEPEEGEASVSLVHFEALLVKRDGSWLMLMEYQKKPATQEEWEAAA
jgi:ketosteroid isomerase-like protein